MEAPAADRELSDEPAVRPEAAARILLPLEPAERALLLTGLGLLAGIAALVGGYWIVDRQASVQLVAVVVAAVAGGRMPAILTGLELGLERGAIIALLILVNTCLLLIALPFVGGAQRVLAAPPAPMARVLGTVERGARARQGLVAALGAWSLAVFIWLPLPMTGGLVGAVIGRLMGIPLPRLLVIMLGSMWVGIATWTIGFEHLYLAGGPAGRVLSWVIAGVLLLWSLALRLRRPEQ